MNKKRKGKVLTNKNILLSSYLFMLTVAVVSCGNEKQKNPKTNTDTAFAVKDTVKENPIIISKKQESKAICEFISYNDDGDYFLMIVRKDGEERSFINDNIESRDLLRGDLIEITWKQDTIYIAGDGDTPELADWVLKVKKIKGGSVSLFRKKYPNPIRFLIYQKSDYSDWFKDKIYLLVEYYLANTKKEIVQNIIDERFSNLIYTIEEQEHEGRMFYIIGIAEEFEHRVNTVQWLYVDVENYSLYEYDLPNDKLILFDK